MDDETCARLQRQLQGSDLTTITLEQAELLWTGVTARHGWIEVYAVIDTRFLDMPEWPSSKQFDAACRRYVKDLTGLSLPPWANNVIVTVGGHAPMVRAAP